MFPNRPAPTRSTPTRSMLRRADRRRRTRRRGVVAVLAAACLALLTAAPSGADDLSNQRKAKEAQVAAAQAAQDALQDSLEDLQGQVATAGQQLLTLQAQLPAAQAAVDTANATLVSTQRAQALIAARLADAQSEQTTLTATMDADTGRVTQLRAAIAQMAREAYQGGELSGWDVVLDSTSSQDFVDGYTQVATALRAQSQALDELNSLQAAHDASANRLAAVAAKITDLKAQADQKVTEAAAAKKAADDAKTALDTLTAQVAAQQAALQSQVADAQAQLAAQDAATSQLNSELASIIAAQKAAGASSTTVTGAVLQNPTAHDPMVVTSEYGMRWQPILHIYRLHAGLDLRDYCGDPVYAARAGAVQWSMYRDGYGNQVMVDHGWVNGASLMTSYSHLTSSVVSAGQQVSTGQLVGYAGMTGGVSTACHLHFEVYINGSTVPPRPYLGL